MSSTLFAEEAALNTLTAEEKAAGWKLLFDGKDASQWRGYKMDKLPDNWSVKDDALTRTSPEGQDIITRDEFESFELSLDWKISKGANSGVMFKVQESAPNSYETGPECQIIDNASQTGPHAQLTGWMYGLYSASVDVTKPIGEWNHMVIKCQKTPAGTFQCEHWLNGTKLVSYEIGSDDWNEKVAKSKFAKWPGFGKADKGHICLQCHEGELAAFRNIKIRELK
jgi:hypothetical protein